ncbi:MAG: calcium-binding protein [Gaiellaceae bacterium]
MSRGIAGLLIDGGAGNDILSAAGGAGTGSPFAHRLTLVGDVGNDTLEGGAGPSALDGGVGNDGFVEGPAKNGPDTISGGPGDDTVSYAQRTSPVRVSLAGELADDGAIGEHDWIEIDVENVVGGAGNDTILGSPFGNGLAGGAGDDTIWAGLGNDLLIGGAGRDKLHGGAGDDVFEAADGAADLLDGGAGTDRAASYDRGIDKLVGIEAR